MYVTTVDYNSRSGADTAPADFNRKYEIAVELVKQLAPQRFPLETELPGPPFRSPDLFS